MTLGRRPIPILQLLSTMTVLAFSAFQLMTELSTSRTSHMLCKHDSYNISMQVTAKTRSLDAPEMMLTFAVQRL